MIKVNSVRKHMPDTFTEVTKQGWGSRIMKSIGGVLIGLLLFMISFVVLYMNEGRVDLSAIAKDAIELSASSSTPDSSATGKLVSVTGRMDSEEVLGDGDYLAPGKYLAYERVAEMYAWDERKETESETSTGGSETTKTTYYYTKVWTEDPEDSDDFRQPSGHENPEMTVSNKSGNVESGTIGAYTVNMQGIELRGLRDLPLTQANTNLEDEARIEKGYVFMGTGSVGSPQVGDIRVSYKTLNQGTNVTAFGKLSGDTIETHNTKKAKVHYLYAGSRDAALDNMHNEYVMSLWVTRAIGFILMWMGLAMIFKPLSVFLDVLPILGKVSRAAVGLITFVVAFILSLLTIIVSMLLHNPFVMVAVLVAVIGGGVYLFKKSRKPRQGPGEAGTQSETSRPAMTAAAPPINPQLKTYIDKARESGMDDGSIRKALVDSGWQADQVDSALRQSSPAPPPPPQG
jgi:hypothetical protein